MVMKIMISLTLVALLILHITTPHADQDQNNTTQMQRRIGALSNQIHQLQQVLIKRDKTLASLHRSTPQVQQTTNKNMAEIIQKIQRQPWNPAGYKQSVERAKTTYNTDKEAKCVEKLAHYSLKHGLSPKNDYYTYKLEQWRETCGVRK